MSRSSVSGRSASSPLGSRSTPAGASSAWTASPERLDLARSYGVEVIDLDSVDDVPEAILDLTDGRGADGTVDAVGMEAHGSPFAKAAISAVGLLPDAVAKPLTDKFAIDRLAALVACDQVRTPWRHGLGQRRLRRRGRPDADDGDVRPRHHDAAGPVPRQALDRRHQQGPASRTRTCWASSRSRRTDVPLEEAPAAYEMFQKKQDGCVKVVLKP